VLRFSLILLQYIGIVAIKTSPRNDKHLTTRISALYKGGGPLRKQWWWVLYFIIFTILKNILYEYL